MQISKSKWVAYIGHREEKKKEIGKEISGLRDKEEIMRDQLERENAWLRGQLQKTGNQIACTTNLSLEAIQCRMLARSYALYLKEQWL